jgi:hypothetical protein
VLFAVGVLVTISVLAWVIVAMQQLGHDLRDANEARDALAAQVEQLGGKPVAGPPGSRGEPGIGPRGPRGEKGEDGKDGRDAPTITPSPGPSGPAGEPGADSTVPGPPGASGQPGADSTVPGPAGPQGERGDSGVDGRDGVDGKDGRPPSSWTFTFGGQDYTCRPVAEGSTDYACESDTPPPDEPGPQALSLALDPQRRQYV